MLSDDTLVAQANGEGSVGTNGAASNGKSSHVDKVENDHSSLKAIGNGHSNGNANGNGQQGEEDASVTGTPVAGIENVQKGDAQQYLNNYKAHRTGISHEEMVRVYTEWANNYDQDLCPGRYNGPEIAAQFVSEHYPSEVRDSIKILDVAAGTGRVGYELSKVGFRQIDALEPSEGMLNVLKGRKIYETCFEDAIGFKPVEAIPSNTYDALVIAGGMGEGHIPVKAIDEMIRVVKSGGTIFIVMREEYLSYVQEYVGKLEPYMNSVAEQGFWRQVSKTVVPEYSFKKNGVVFNYEVLTEEWPTD